jgi:outer membrane immunogenic protein
MVRRTSGFQGIRAQEFSMTRIVIGMAVSLLATSAMAADLAPAPNMPRPYVKAPPMVDPGYNWTGFYAGLNGGYSWGRSNATVMPTTQRAGLRTDRSYALETW